MDFEIIRPIGMDRRTVIRGGLTAATGTISWPRQHLLAQPYPGALPRQQRGVIPSNDRAAGDAWGRWLGRIEDHVLLYFDQRSWPALAASIDYQLGIGQAVAASGRRVQWSVPIGGRYAYGEAASGKHDALFERLATGILTCSPERLGRICIRLPWEFNLSSQSLAARDISGRWDERAYVAAFRHLAGSFRAISSRFFFDWCPNIGGNSVDPERFYPGDDLVDVVSLDVYYQSCFDGQGHVDGGAAIFEYRRTQPFGLDWLVRFGQRHQKPIGLSEWGVDSNAATAFMRLICSWIRAQGPTLAHHNYWDRSDGGINARLSNGRLPAISAIYKRAFG